MQMKTIGQNSRLQSSSIYEFEMITPDMVAWAGFEAEPYPISRLAKRGKERRVCPFRARTLQEAFNG